MNLRSSVVTAIVSLDIFLVALLGATGETAAQTGPFKCAERTTVESNMRRTLWLGQDGDHCRLFVRGQRMLDTYLAWYAPTIEL